MRTVRSPRVYSKTELAFLKKNASKPRADLLAAFVKKFGREDVTKWNLQDLMRRRGWYGFGKTAPIFNELELNFLQQHKELPRRELLTLVREKFNKPTLKYESLKEVCKRKRILSGRACPPKLPVGSRSVAHNGCVRIKINDKVGVGERNSNYKYEHRLRWEELYGPIPKGHKLKCITADRTNTTPSNWACVPNGVMPRLAKRGFAAAPAELKPTILAVSKLEHEIQKRTRDQLR